MAVIRTGDWAAYPALVRGEIRRLIEFWGDTLVPSLITLVLYLAIFGGMIAERIGPISGYNYIDFMVPGLIMMTVIMNSYQNVVFSLYMAKFEGFIEEMLVAPIPNRVLLAGYITGGVLRSVIVAVLSLLICWFFTELRIIHMLVVLAAVLCASVLFSIAGFINALYADSFDDLFIVPLFVLTPLTYLGGVFYSIELLPEFWQKVSLANPVLYMINAFRYGFIGVTDINLMTAFAMMLAFILVFYAIAMNLLNKGVGLRS